MIGTCLSVLVLTTVAGIPSTFMHEIEDARALFASDFGEVQISADPTTAKRKLIFKHNSPIFSHCTHALAFV